MPTDGFVVGSRANNSAGPGIPGGGGNAMKPVIAKTEIGANCVFHMAALAKAHQQNFARRARGSAASTGISLGESNKVRGYPGRGVPLYSCGEAGRCGAWRVSLPMGPLCGWQLTGKGGSGVAWWLRAPCQPAK